MKKTLLSIPLLLALCGVVSAQVPNSTAPMVPIGSSGGGGGAVTPTGTFTAGDLIVGSGSTSIQDAANQAAPVNSPTAILRQAITGSAPASICSGASLATAFNCPLAGMGNGVATQLNGVATLTQPTTGYQITPNLASSYLYFENNSGWNNATGSSSGRTGAVADYIKVNQFGQGDSFGHFVTGFVNGAKAGATSFLANPAVSALGVQLTAGAAGVYMQPIGDLDCNDGGFDVACIGAVFNLTRTATPGGSVGPSFPTGALGATWIGQLMKCGGSVACDAAYGIGGTAAWNVGLDLADGSYGTNQAAIVMQAAQRTYLSATTGTNNFPQNLTLGTDYFTAPAAGQFNLVLGGANKLTYNGSNLWTLAGGTLNVTAGNVDIGAGNILGFRGGSSPISSPANNVIQIGSPDAATATAQTFGFQNVATGNSNVAGALAIIRGSLGTGTGPSGNIQIEVGKTGTTGSTVNSAFPMLSANAGAATTATVQFGDGTNFTTYDSCTALTTGATGIVACTASDERLKKNITPIDPNEALSFAMNVPVKIYDFKNPDGGFADARHHIGMMAQDIKKYAPRIAETMVTKTDPTDLTPDGTWQVDYNDAGPIALAAIKKQQELISQLVACSESWKCRLFGIR